MLAEQELSSCPFCGSDEVSLSEGTKNGEYPANCGIPFFYVECHQCAAMGPESFDDNEQAAINWNTRDI
jgi:Lar family restriction alleviation protein